MLDTVNKKNKGNVPPRGRRFDDQSNDLSLPLAKAIRDISTMIGNRASCGDIALAVTQCTATLLPGCSAMAFEIDTNDNSATVAASSNAPFVSIGERLALTEQSALTKALQNPFKIHSDDCTSVEQLFPSRAMYPVTDDAGMLCKAVVRMQTSPLIFAVIADADMSKSAESVLLTLSELLNALCSGYDSAQQSLQNQNAVYKAKKEWEQIVDTLQDLVCVIDSSGHVVRANRTTERWSLGSVKTVRGMHLHNLIHPTCTAAHCEFEKLISALSASQGQCIPNSVVLTDKQMNRTLSIETRPISKPPRLHNTDQDSFVVVVISDVTALHRARNELKILNEDLEARVLARTDELRRVNDDLHQEIDRRRRADIELQASRDELASLTQQLINSQEDERSRLSRELHDSIGQSLGAIKYTLERIGSAGDRLSPAEHSEVLELAIRGVTDAIKDTRAIAMRLRPPILDDMGAVAAVSWLIKHFSETYPSVEFHQELSVTADEIPQELTTPLYRIVQESLNNVVKHASATSALVSLNKISTKLILEVVDDGIGFDSNNTDTGQFRKLGNFGRLGMRERAVNSNGILAIESDRDIGTKVQVEWEIGYE